MKKFFKNLLACFIILFIFGGVCFYLGWTQFKVPSNGFGIIVSKTGGISKELIVPGKFSWHWEFLIPTNAKIKTFIVKNYSVKSEVKGGLPSGDVYSAALDEAKTDFSYDFRFSASVSLSQEHIIKLLKDSKITDEESLEQYVNDSFDCICRNVAANFLKSAEKKAAVRPELLSCEELLKISGAEDAFPELSISVFTVTKSVFPDIELYQKARTIYLSNLGINVSSKEDVSESSSATKKEEPAPVIEEINQEEKDMQEKFQLFKKLFSAN